MPILPDVLSHNLDVVICGEAAGYDSFESGTYYRNKSNKFWNIVYETRLTPIKLDSADFGILLDYGIGLTNLISQEMHSDRAKRRKEIKCDKERMSFFRSELEKKIFEYTPRIIAFNGKGNAELFFDRKITTYGLQTEFIGNSSVFVLESTSGSANAYWNNGYSWYALVDFLRLHAPRPKNHHRRHHHPPFFFAERFHLSFWQTWGLGLLLLVGGYFLHQAILRWLA